MNGTLTARRKAWAAVLAGSCAGAALAAEDLPSVTARLGDPFEQCEAVANALPRSFVTLPRLGRVRALRLSDDVAEYCAGPPGTCRRAAVEFDGLRADLLEVRRKPGLAVLDIELTASRWRLLKGWRVGEELGPLLKTYGVDAPDNHGEFQICGDTVCLEVGHRDQRVTRLRLDCQRAW